MMTALPSFFRCCWRCAVQGPHGCLLLMLLLLVCHMAVAVPPAGQRSAVALKPPHKRTSAAATEVVMDSADQASASKRNSGCPTCTRGMSDDEIEQKIFIERWKADLLKKLGMDEVPKRPPSLVNIPTPLYNAYVENPRSEVGDSDQADGVNEQVIVVGRKADRFCGRNCFHFRLSKGALAHQTIASLQLWVHQLKVKDPLVSDTAVLLVRKMTTNKRYNIGKSVTRHRLRKATGWVALDLMSSTGFALQSILAESNVSFYMKMDCRGCKLSTEVDNVPFLIFNVKRVSNRRRKRSIDCHAQVTECCRERLYINFTDFGWDDWIIRPQGYEAFHCRGSCRSSSMPTFGHTSIIQRFNQFKTKDSYEQYIKTCCSPRRFSKMSLLYYDNEGKIYKKDVPDMIVEECGCS